MAQNLAPNYNGATTETADRSHPKATTHRPGSLHPPTENTLNKFVFDSFLFQMVNANHMRRTRLPPKDATYATEVALMHGQKRNRQIGENPACRAALPRPSEQGDPTYAPTESRHQTYRNRTLGSPGH